MRSVIVVDNPELWPLRLPNVEVVAARDYLLDDAFADTRRLTVYNMCRQYGYQRVGYYVSLLAAARAHRAVPSIDTLQTLRVAPAVRVLSEDMDSVLQRAMAPLKSDRFILSLYFGRNLAKRYDQLGRMLFNQFPVPFLRAIFVRDDRWRLQSLRPIAAGEIPDSHHDFVVERTTQYLAKPDARRRRKQQAPRYEIAILWDPNAVDSPSDERAIKRFKRAAVKLGLEASVVGPDDYGRLAEFDALFIRETTYVSHHTYRFAKRAEVEGLIVLDDPQSIVRCTNKVYQAELFRRHNIPSPATMVVHRRNADAVADQLGLPCVLKKPDSSFSHGVVKVETPEELDQQLNAFFDDSELVLAQSFTPSTYDWRIGVLDGKTIYACKYHMARGHWQIVDRDEKQHRYGKVETIPLDEVPSQASDVARNAAALMGDGLYGVDLKETTNGFIVIEVNDNPNIDGGYEDAGTKDELYLTIMRWFRTRLDARGG